MKDINRDTSHFSLCLVDTMKKIGCVPIFKESDIIETFIKAQGPGGQKVNKSSSCVYLKHIPTGIEVKCQEARSQAQNRVIARRLLEEKIRKHLLDKVLRKKQEKEKLRRQKRKRTGQEKLRILEEKKKHSQKKKLRARITNFHE